MTLCHHVPMPPCPCNCSEVVALWAHGGLCLFPGLCGLVCRHFREGIKSQTSQEGQEGPPQQYIPLRCFTFWLSSKEVAKEFLFLLWLAWLTPQKGTLGYSPEIPQSHFGNVALLSDHLSQCIPIQRGISSIICWALYVRGWKTCLCCNPLEFNNSVPAGALYM